MRNFLGNISSSTRIFFVSIGIISIGSFVVFATTFSWPTTPSVGIDGGKFKTTFDKMSVANGCGSGNYLQGIKADGSLICGDINTLAGTKTSQNSLYTVSGDGLYTQYFKEIFNDCGAGYFVQGFSADKKMICSDSEGNIKPMGITIDTGISTSFPTRPAAETYTTYLKNILSNDCGPKHAIIGFDANGYKIGCRDNSCIPTTWTPLPADICNGTTFTQTSNCGNTRSAVGTQIWENISQYTNTSAGAGGSRTYDSITYPFKVHFNFHVWTEDLIYDIRCYDDKGVQIAYFGPGGKDKDWDIDHFSSSCYANRIHLNVTEGGHSGADSFGYTLTGDPKCGAK